MLQRIAIPISYHVRKERHTSNNKYNTFIVNECRPILGTDGTNSDYINASFVDVSDCTS